MTIITRDDLRKIYIENIEENNGKIIEEYVKIIQEKVIAFSKKGLTNYTYHFNSRTDNDEKSEIIMEVVGRLREIFVDSIIKFNKASVVTQTDNYIVIIWKI